MAAAARAWCAEAGPGGGVYVEHGDRARGLGAFLGGGNLQRADGCCVCGGAAWGVRAGLRSDEKAGSGGECELGSWRGMLFTHAIARTPAENFAEGLTSFKGKPVDYQKALEQHEAYCAALEHCGLEVMRLEPNLAHPDSTFVEDVAVLT